MKRPVVSTVFLLSLPLGIAQADSLTVKQLLQDYAAMGAMSADAVQGRELWNKKFKADDGSERSCASCHTRDLTASGQHVRTHKAIQPMAPSTNPDRLTKPEKVEKWFKRNCKWTLGHECSPQEKTDLLTYIDKHTKF